MNNKFPNPLTLESGELEQEEECLVRESETIKEYKLPYST